MPDIDTRRRIDAARDVLVGKVLDPSPVNSSVTDGPISCVADAADTRC